LEIFFPRYGCAIGVNSGCNCACISNHLNRITLI
jgi:hypothetical protein